MARPGAKEDEITFGHKHLDEAYRKLKSELTNAVPGDSLVLVDDLAHLEWAGFDEEDIIRFLRSTRSLLRVVRVFLDLFGSVRDLFSRLGPPFSWCTIGLP